MYDSKYVAVKMSHLSPVNWYVRKYWDINDWTEKVVRRTRSWFQKKRTMIIHSRGIPLSHKKASHHSSSNFIKVTSDSKHFGESLKRKATKLEASPHKKTPKKSRVKEDSFTSLREEDLIVEMQEENPMAETQMNEEHMVQDPIFEPPQEVSPLVDTHTSLIQDFPPPLEQGTVAAPIIEPKYDELFP